MTKEQQLTQQLAIETAVRLGLCGCMINLIVEHARVVGGDQSKAIETIRGALNKTASSIKVSAKDTAGGAPDISEFVQQNVSKLLDQCCKDAQKRIEKSAH